MSAFEKGWRWCRRRPVIAGLTAALMLAILGGLIGTSLGLLAASCSSRRPQPRARRDQGPGQERAQTDLAEQRLYDVRMNLVQRYWDDYNSDLFHGGLEEQLPVNQGGADRRGFEWFYWQRKRYSGYVTLRGNSSNNERLAFSPDGKQLATSRHDGTVTVWDVATRGETVNFKGHSQPVRDLAFSPDCKRIASASIDGTVKVWDSTTGHEVLTIKGHTSAGSRAWRSAPMATGSHPPR